MKKVNIRFKKAMQYSPFLLCVCVCIFVVTSCTNKHTKYEYVKAVGQAQGTYYAITYENSVQADLQPAFDSILAAFDSVYSNYNTLSVISFFNAHNSVYMDSSFSYFIRTAQRISEITNGAFDITIAPLANAWRFGFQNASELPNQATVSELLQYVGMNKLLVDGDTLKKSHPNVQIIANAIAQGFSADVLAAYLDSRGVANYLIDVGGEMKTKGVNAQSKPWTIGITKPIENIDSLPVQDSYMHVVSIQNKALATSGNYRKYYVEDGKKYSHTIDPTTGYPVRHSLLSATVIAPTCIEADALATACMVMGLDKAKVFFESYPQYQAILIYDCKDSLCVYQTKGVE